MKQKLDCAIVRDLLPMYVEGLTSGETTAAVQAHLAGCGECTAAEAAMREGDAVQVPETPEGGREYMKKVRRRGIQRILAAVLCICILAAGVIYNIGRVRSYKAQYMEVTAVYQLPDGAIYFSLLYTGPEANWSAFSLKGDYRDNGDYELNLGYTHTGSRIEGVEAFIYENIVYTEGLKNEYLEYAPVNAIYYRGWQESERDRLTIWQRGDEISPAPPELVQRLEENAAYMGRQLIGG